MGYPCTIPRPALCYTHEDLRLLVFMTLFPQATAWAVMMAYTSWQVDPDFAYRCCIVTPPTVAFLLHIGSFETCGWVAAGGVAIGCVLARIGRSGPIQAIVIQALGFLFTAAVLAWGAFISNIERCWTSDPILDQIGGLPILGVLGSTGCWLLYRDWKDRAAWLPVNEFAHLCLLLAAFGLDTHHH